MRSPTIIPSGMKIGSEFASCFLSSSLTPLNLSKSKYGITSPITTSGPTKHKNQIQPRTLTVQHECVCRCAHWYMCVYSIYRYQGTVMYIHVPANTESIYTWIWKYLHAHMNIWVCCILILVNGGSNDNCIGVGTLIEVGAPSTK